MSDFLSIAEQADAAILEAVGELVTYRAGGVGPAVSMLALIGRASADATSFGTKLRMAGRVLSFRVADVAAPSPGDTVTAAGGEVLTIKGRPALDEAGLMWRAEA